MFGCFINLWEVEGLKAFFKKTLGYTGGLYRSLSFFGKLWAAIFFQKFRGPYVKIHRQWSFRMDCYEIRDPFWEVMDCKYIFTKV
jgi:hypothetical protein